MFCVNTGHSLRRYESYNEMIVHGWYDRLKYSSISPDQSVIDQIRQIYLLIVIIIHLSLSHLKTIHWKSLIPIATFTNLWNNEKPVNFLIILHSNLIVTFSIYVSHFVQFGQSHSLPQMRKTHLWDETREMWTKHSLFTQFWSTHQSKHQKIYFPINSAIRTNCRSYHSSQLHLTSSSEIKLLLTDNDRLTLHHRDSQKVHHS